MLTALLKTWQTNDVFVTFGSVFHVADPLGEFVRVRSGYVMLCMIYIIICIYGSVSRVATPPHMVWVQNLHFGYIFMEPAETHGIYNVLTSLASETVVFAAFCNTTLYTTTLIVLLLLLLPLLLLLLLL